MTERLRIRTLTPDAAQRLLDYRKRGVPVPLVITELKQKIEDETRLAEQHTERTGQIDHDHIDGIVELKLNLDDLFADWAEGKIT